MEYVFILMLIACLISFFLGMAIGLQQNDNGSKSKNVNPHLVTIGVSTTPKNPSPTENVNPNMLRVPKPKKPRPREGKYIYPLLTTRGEQRRGKNFDKYI